jgi:hypothetical protein
MKQYLIVLASKGLNLNPVGSLGKVKASKLPSLYITGIHRSGNKDFCPYSIFHQDKDLNRNRPDY